MLLKSVRARLAGAAALVLTALVAGATWTYMSSTQSPPMLDVPSGAGLNYGMPHSLDGSWVGTEWLRSTATRGPWLQTQPALAADLDSIRSHNLGRVIRLFIGLDQTMVWDPNGGFDGFDEPSLQHFGQALDMIDARGMRAVVVIFDQEEVASRGNFHFEALDGIHEVMRRHYLTALDEFLRRFGNRQTVIGWDLFNEAYNSLGRDGALPAPPHADPVSPNYSDSVIHEWLRDLYVTAKRAAPAAQFTVSDATELYWNPDPDLAKYEDVVDFYDIHVYDDRPVYPDWRALLSKPYIVGEAGASTADQHYEDQSINSQAVSYLLQHEQSAGVSLVLVQGRTFTPGRDSLTPTGMVLADYLSRNPGAVTRRQPMNPLDSAAAAVVATGRRLKRWLGI